MRAWRLARRRYAALDGAGARRYGGRWNRPGLPIVYASEHLSLAVLEIIVHLEVALDEFPADYVKIAIDVPDALSIRRVERLPKAEAEMTEIGSRWYESGSSAALAVPSIVVPEEFNLLFNPEHAEFRKVKAAAPEPFRFDRRLLLHAS